MPKISIILPSYNGSKFIKESIDSILNQTFNDWELILVNDCSKDDTLEIMKNYENKDKRIKIINNAKNQKLPESLNIGFREAKGEYLTWTSDDNIYKYNAIEYMENYLDKNKECDFISCSMDYIDESGNFIREDIKKTQRPYKLALACNIGACFMYRKTIKDKIGEYDKELFCAEDYDYWCRIALNGKIEYSSENLYKYRINSASLTANNIETVNHKSEIIRKKYIFEFLKVYEIPKKTKSRIYYEIWKLFRIKKYLVFVLLSNPFLILHIYLKSLKNYKNDIILTKNGIKKYAK